MSGMLGRALLSLFLLAGVVHAASLDESDYERVLLPVNIVGESPGAFGSRWTTDTEIANSGATPVDVKWTACPVLIDPPCPDFRRIPPGGHAIRVDAIHGGPMNTPGVFLYIPKNALAQIHLNSRVQDISRQAETWGTEQPLVRISDYLQDMLLINVPNDDRFRTTLRIYGLSYAPQQARLRIWPLTSDDAPLVDQTITVNGILPILPIPFPNTPAYAELALESYAALAGKGALRIEVSSADTQALWAFASVTNNATQHVTLVTPQPADRR